MCRRRSSPSPPVTVISGVEASKRGPGIRPALISLRITMSRRGLAELAPTHDVKPPRRTRRALCIV